MLIELNDHTNINPDHVTRIIKTRESIPPVRNPFNGNFFCQGPIMFTLKIFLADGIEPISFRYDTEEERDKAYNEIINKINNI